MVGAAPCPGAERIQRIDPETPEAILFVRVVIVVASMVDDDNERCQRRRLDLVYRTPCSSCTTAADIDEGAATSRAQVDANPGRVRSAVRHRAAWCRHFGTAPCFVRCICTGAGA
jgi:hypothetical protein